MSTFVLSDAWLLAIKGNPATVPVKLKFCESLLNCKWRYSALIVQFGRKSHSTPPPAVQPPGVEEADEILDANGTVVPGHPGPWQVRVTAFELCAHAKPPVPYRSTFPNA